MQPPSPSRTRALVAVLPLAVLGVWGCNLVDSVQADKVLAGTVIATPEADLMFLLPDASYTIPFDSGIPIPLPDGGLPISTKVPSQTVAAIFFGQRAPDYTSQPKGIAGASVTISIDEKTFTLSDQGSGAYGLTSQDDTTFLYKDDAKIKVTVVNAGTTYTATVKAPPRDEISQFKAVKPWPLQQAAGQALQLTRGNTDDIAFTTVIEVNENTKLSDINSIPATYTDVPKTAMDLLDLVANDSMWKRKVITIPSSAFPTANSYYGVLITAVRRGETSSNLFTASALLVGKADLGVVKTR